MKNLVTNLYNKHIRIKVITPVFFLIALLVFVVIGMYASKIKQQAITNVQIAADASCREQAAEILSTLINCYNDLLFFRYAIDNYNYVMESNRFDYIKQTAKQTLAQNQNISAVWCQLPHTIIGKELAHDKTDNPTLNHLTYALYRGKTAIQSYQGTENNPLDLCSESTMAAVKETGLAVLSEPYQFSYTQNENDQTYKVNLVTPLVKNGSLIGVIGADITLNTFGKYLHIDTPYPDSYGMLVSNNGTIACHPDNNMVGNHLRILKYGDTQQDTYLKYIAVGKPISFTSSDNENYITIYPLNFENKFAPWAVCLVVPLKHINKSNAIIFLRTSILGFVGLIIVSSIIFMLLQQITGPINKVSKLLEKMSLGMVDTDQKLYYNTKDEIGNTIENINKIIDSISRVRLFAEEIGQKRLDTDFFPLSTHDKLGNAMISLRESIRSSYQKEIEQKQLDMQKEWISKGITSMSDILRQHIQSLSLLTLSALRFLVDYMNAVQGGVYTKNDDDPDNIFFELISTIAFGREKLLDCQIKPEEGLVGRCAAEELTIYLTEIPENYPRIKSGLGDATPKVIILVPLKTNDDVLGAIELISFREYEDFEIQFLEKVGEDLALTVANVRTNQKTARLLEQSQKQSKELALKEEQTRQTIEELNATQEEVYSRTEQTSAIINAFNQISLIAEYDAEGHLIEANDRFLGLHGVSRRQVLGKRQENFDKNVDKEKIITMWNSIKQGQTVREIRVIDNNILSIRLLETYIPVKDEEGAISKIINISVDITHALLNEN